ncbi:preprotein translocase subunit YajC [Aeromicrobium panaciterrae]|uniref:Preprotein translocase subunit YajC n=1 Tax=Aeromicrobium panaciterrae TaxID=363861 RepID=A0ABU1UNH4_9ACTN|nr:preprotein translocase subunit YajC [Aeromicrobium panaciterrae]MDR7086726.1 preprotein translocase subunit YajC [Aeromicrobium panaciterrae]
MSNWVDFLPLLFLVLIFWLLIIRPARARQRAFLKTQSELSVGDEIMLASGIYGEISSIGDTTLELRIAPETVVTVDRQAVARVIPAAPTAGSDD